MKKISKHFFIYLCVVNAVIFPGYSDATTETKIASCAGQTSCQATVVRVIDGDTVELQSGERVRYIGVDTPESVAPAKPVECFGKEAAEKNKGLVENKTVRLEKDVSDTDKFGRLLRYVYQGDIFINDALVRDGYAHALSYPPDVKLLGQLREAEKEARDNKRGLWADNACPEKEAPPKDSQGSEEKTPADKEQNNNQESTNQTGNDKLETINITADDLLSLAIWVVLLVIALYFGNKKLLKKLLGK